MPMPNAKKSMSMAMLKDLDAIKSEFGMSPGESVLKSSLSMMDLPRTPFQDRRSAMYKSLPFVALPGMSSRTNDVVRTISYEQYVRERHAYSALDEPGRTFSERERLASPGGDAAALRYEAVALARRRTELEALGRPRGDSLSRATSWLQLPRVDSRGSLNLALVPRTADEAALYAACQTAEDEIRDEVVTFPLTMACVVACLSQFLVGYNTAALNAPEPYVFPGHSTAAWAVAVAAFAIGGPFGAAAGGRLANARGRRPAILLDAALFFVGGTALALAPSMAVLVVARFVVGVASGVASVLVPVYLGELAPPVLRGTFGTCTQFALVLGILAAGGLALLGASRWRILFSATPALDLVQLACAPYKAGAGEGGLQLELLAIICFKESIHTSRT